MNSGIYLIFCSISGKLYVGSSKDIPKRWKDHRRDLNKGRSTCTILQKAWRKHGEGAFVFWVLERCEVGDLEPREQNWVDRLRPELNSITDIRRRFGPEAYRNRVAGVRARAAKITHCPRGHVYDLFNTYVNAKGKRICRECNKARVSSVYATETLEQREARRERTKAYYERTREVRLVKRRAYTAAHRAEKAEYDRRRYEAKKAARL